MYRILNNYTHLQDGTAVMFFDGIATKTSQNYVYQFQQDMIIFRNSSDFLMMLTVNGTSYPIKSGSSATFVNVTEFTVYSSVPFSNQFFTVESRVDSADIIGGGGGTGGGNGGTIVITPTQVWSGKKGSFIGDSITAGTGTTKTYHAYLQEMLGLSVARNYGISGTTITYGDPLDQNITDRINSMDADSDLIVMLGGTNDFQFDKPIGSIYTVDGSGTMTPNTTQTTFYGALNVMCQRFITRYPNKQIVLMTPLHRSNFQSQLTEYQRNAAGLYLKDYVDAIKAAGAYWGIPVLDLFSVSGLNPNVASNAALYFSPTDKLHPNADGHKLMADRLAAFLTSLTVGSGTVPVTPDSQPPTAPTGVTVGAITSSTVALSWTGSTDNIGVSDYLITGGPSTVTATGTSAVVGGLSASTAYTFYVQARDSAGNLSAKSSGATATTSAGAGGGATIVSDTFTRADTTAGLGAATPTGQAWATGVGTFGISSNQALLAISDGENVTTIDAGVSDCSVSANFTQMVSGGARLVFRYTDINNYLMIEPVSSGVKMYKRVTGGWVEIGGGWSLTHADGEEIKVILNGSTIEIYQNSVLITSMSDNFNQTATKHGIGVSSGAVVGVGRIDNFLVRQ